MEDLSDLRDKVEKLYIMVSRFAKEETSVLKRLNDIEEKMANRSKAASVDFGTPRCLVNNKLNNVNGGGVDSIISLFIS